MSKIRLGPELALPAEATADVIAIVGRRGRGKTTTATVLVEELHAAGERFVVADPVGVWWGLKSSRDGKAQGIPVVVMGGDRGDAPLEDTAGTVIADFVADPSSPSVVLDFRAFRKGQITRFMTAFLEQLYHRNRAPLHIVLDEADQFAPQRFTGDVARLVGAAEDVCKMGRARGLHPIVITQRPAALNKNVLTQAGILIAHGITGPQDIKAVEAWIHERADEDRRAEVLSSLPGLKRGEAWVWAPELEILKQVQVRDRKTFDSSATPKGSESKGPRVLAEVDLDALKVRIASTIEKAKAEDPRELKKTIADLRAQLQKKERVLAEVDERTKRIDASLDRVKARAKPLVTDAQVKRLESAIAHVEAHAERTIERIREQLDGVNNREGEVLRVAQEIKAALAAARAARPADSLGAPGTTSRVAEGAGRPAMQSRPAPVVPRAAESNGGPSGGLRRMLIALAQRDGLTRGQLGVRAQLSSRGGSFDTYLSRGRTHGWITSEGDRLRITEAGLAALGGAWSPLPTGRALLDYWKGVLGGGAARMLEVLASVYPDGIDRDALGERANVSARGGSFDTYLSRLRTLELVQGRPLMKASEELFG